MYMFDFFGMNPVLQFKWVQKNCYVGLWPLFPFMPVVKGTPVELETIEDIGFMHAQHSDCPCITIYNECYLPEIMEYFECYGYIPPDLDYIKFNSAREAVEDGWRIDE